MEFSIFLSGKLDQATYNSFLTNFMCKKWLKLTPFKEYVKEMTFVLYALDHLKIEHRIEFVQTKRSGLSENWLKSWLGCILELPFIHHLRLNSHLQKNLLWMLISISKIDVVMLQPQKKSKVKTVQTVKKTITDHWL